MATNPPVPATPLDVEACAGLANREAAGCEYAAQRNREQAKRPLDIDPEYAARARRLADESAAEAATWRALASELLSMGKDRERLREIELLTPDIAQLLDGWHADGTAWSEWDESVRRRLADWHLKSAARSALPGMGKDSDDLSWMESIIGNLDAKAEVFLAGLGTVGAAKAFQCEVAPATSEGSAAWRSYQGPTLRDAIAAARAAQPQETSADAD